MEIEWRKSNASHPSYQTKLYHRVEVWQDVNKQWHCSFYEEDSMFATYNGIGCHTILDATELEQAKLEALALLRKRLQGKIDQIQPYIDIINKAI